MAANQNSVGASKSGLNAVYSAGALAAHYGPYWCATTTILCSTNRRSFAPVIPYHAKAYFGPHLLENVKITSKR